jgi:predicted  nucleic acid-binding Zn-ribbon protein
MEATQTTARERFESAGQSIAYISEQMERAAYRLAEIRSRIVRLTLMGTPLSVAEAESMMGDLRRLTAAAATIEEAMEDAMRERREAWEAMRHG